MRQQVRQQFQTEADRLTSILHQAADDHTSLSDARDRVLASVQDGASEWETLFTDAFSTISQQSGERLIAQFVSEGLLPKGSTYDPERSGSQVADALEHLPAQAAQHVLDTTQSALDGQLSSALDAHEIDDLIASLQQQYDDWQAGRVDSIADTQVVGGWSLGELDAAFQAADVTGAQAVRTWTATMDAHTRPEHAEADGQQVGLDEPFTVGGESLMYPGDPNGSAGNTINCRCQVSYDLQLTTGSDTTGDETKARRKRRTTYRRFMSEIMEAVL